MPGVYTINPLARSAELQIVKDGVVGTTFLYADGVVTLTERLAPITFTRKEYEAQMEQIRSWVRAINDQLDPARAATVPHVLRLRKTASKVLGLYRHGAGEGVLVSDVEYVLASAVTTFQPRPQIVFAWMDFCYWVTFLDWFQDEVEAFQ